MRGNEAILDFRHHRVVSFNRGYLHVVHICQRDRTRIRLAMNDGFAVKERNHNRACTANAVPTSYLGTGQADALPEPLYSQIVIVEYFDSISALLLLPEELMDPLCFRSAFRSRE